MRIIDMNGEGGDSGEKDEERLSGGCCLATGCELVSGLRKLILRCLGIFRHSFTP